LSISRIPLTNTHLIIFLEVCVKLADLLDKYIPAFQIPWHFNKFQAVPPYLFIVTGTILFLVAVVSLVRDQIFSIRWNWLTFLVWAVYVAVIGGVLFAITKKDVILLASMLLVVILMIGFVGNIVMGIVEWIKEPPVSSQNTVLKTGPNSWEITYHYSRGVSTGITLRPGQRVVFTGANPFTTYCSRMGNRIDSRPFNSQYIATVSFKDCDGLIGFQYGEGNTKDRSGFNRVYAVVE